MKRKWLKTAITDNVCLKALGITMLAFLLSMLIVSPFSASTTAVFATPESGGDFNMSDLFAQVADRRPVRELDNDIVIVDIGHLDRSGIADLISTISLCGPSAIGVDINFEDSGDPDEDTLLLSALSMPGIVLPLGVEPDGECFSVSDRPFFYDIDRSHVYGVTNLPSKSEKSPIREFHVEFMSAGGDRLMSFASALAAVGRPQAWTQLKKRRSDLEIIDYVSREFTVVDAGQVADRAEQLSGKIVLVGAVDEAGDMHSTPVNSYMSGIMIHAHALSTIIRQAWYTELPPLTDYIIAFLICYVIVLTSIGINSRIKGLMIRVAQVVLVYVAVRIGYMLYVDRHIVVSFSHTLLMIAFGLFAIDIWNGMHYIGRYVWGRISGLLLRKNSLT